jgi:hypothetical protein
MLGPVRPGETGIGGVGNIYGLCSSHCFMRAAVTEDHAEYVGVIVRYDGVYHLH